MAYLGNSPVLSQQEYRNIDNISGSFNGSTTSFALLVNGVAPVPAPQSSNQCLISVNGVVQKPDDTGATGFRISGGNIIFSSAPTGGQSFFGVILAGADYIYAGENFPDGTVSAPSITFAQDTDTGFFRSGAGEIKYTANGTAVVTLSSNNLTAPSFIPTSSSAPTNGVYLPAANTVAISTNGSGRLFVDSNGNVGVGGSVGFGAIDHGIHVTGSGAQEGIRLQTSAGSSGILEVYAESGGATLDTRGSGYIRFNNVATEWARFDSSGRLGIGTSSPGKTLDVSGSFRQSGGEFLIEPSASNTVVSIAPQTSTNGAILRFTNGTTTSYFGKENSAGNYTWSSGGTAYATVISAYGSTAPIQFGHNSPSVTLDSSGRLGIGTTSPITALDVRSASDVSDSSRYNLVVADLSSYASGVGGGINFGYKFNSAGNVIQRAASIGVRKENSTDGDYASALTFHTTSNGSPTAERARIDSSGRLLVGTSSSYGVGSTAQAKFQASDTTSNIHASFTDWSTADSGGIIVLGKAKGGSAGNYTIVANGNVLGEIRFAGADGTDLETNGASIRAEVDGTPGANDMPGRLVFSTTADGASSPTERFRIGSAGQLGVGGANYGTTGQVLTSGGASAAPTWGSSIVSGTAVASTSGTSIDFTGIPSWVKRVTVMLNEVSTNGSSAMQIQIGAGSITSSGYTGYATRTGAAPNNVYTAMSAGFLFSDNLSATATRSGLFVLTNISSNNWVLSGSCGSSTTTGDTCLVNGKVSLSGTLDRIRITTVNGTDTFDAGSINILYE